MLISELLPDERSREKLLKQGASTLSDVELLAIFLRVGVAGEGATDVARRLIKRFDGLRGLLSASQKDFCAEHGLGAAKYAQLQAVLEMSKRYLAQDMQQGDNFANPQAVKRFLQLQLAACPREQFWGIFLNNQHHVLARQCLAEGTINSATVHLREVVKAALHHNAAAMIVAHNHPSGHPEPSQADRHLTDQLKQALALIDVRLLDHFIIAGSRCVSLAEWGWI
jgi:DNA repair protein RadC